MLKSGPRPRQVRREVQGCVSGSTSATALVKRHPVVPLIHPATRGRRTAPRSELKVPLPDVVGMQCRQPSLEDTGEIKLRLLVKEGAADAPVAGSS